MNTFADNKIIEIRDLHKSFGDIKAVDGISFEVRRGELFAFLGVNGAGKSTTINMLCGQLKKDSGQILIDGEPIENSLAEIKGKIGVVFQHSVLDKALSVKDNLESRAALYGIYGNEFKKRLDELCELLELKELLRRPLGKLSGGQRRRIDVARALLHRPKILILDEPTTGLDPQTRKILWQVIEDLRKDEDMTVFLTTHYMEEAADADYVVIIDSGRISASGTPLELKNAYTGDFITLYGVDEDSVKSLGIEYEMQRDLCRLSVPNTRAATELIVAHPEIFSDYEITKGKMDDVFLAVTGKKLSDSEQRSDGGAKK
ncbi:MAG: ABC transporter ATP-binding protein [Ruminococcaceae bacterium]|nr:ABC transporter ATP-binding protein [Oscillospiraceae bacterium]